MAGLINKRCIMYIPYTMNVFIYVLCDILICFLHMLIPRELLFHITYSQTIVLMVFEIIFQYVPFSTDNDGNGGGNGGGVSKGGD